MANKAFGREAGQFVVRVGGAVVILQMTAHATGADIREIAVDVTGSAGQGRVHARQRESGS